MMKKHSTLLFLIIITSVIKLAAQASWAPTNAPNVWDRYDDTYFINPDTGWAVTIFDSNYSSRGAYEYATVIKTTDGGITWQKLLDSSNSMFRDIAFLDAQNGFIGMLQPTIIGQDTFFMYQTHDGGVTWLPVTNMPGPKQAGICGMRVINDSTLYGVGRYFGPAGFYKTTNKGLTWTYQDMSPLACGLVDVFFFGADTGFVCGPVCGTLPGFTTFDYGSGTILFTTDAGNTWHTKAVTPRTQEWCWKMSFPSRNIGYASVESGRTTPIDSQHCLKTIDGGQTWQDMFIAQVPSESSVAGGFDEQGIGFINDSVGWVGGRNNQFGLAPVFAYKTTDGGINWAHEYWGENINRFRKLSDTLAYFSGKTIYKYSSTHVPLEVPNITEQVVQVEVFPNPANTVLTVKADQADLIRIFSTTGQMLLETSNPPGNQIKINSLATGFYIVQVKTKSNTWNIKWEKY